MTAPATARVLVVCTANICRSPAAEGVLSAGLHGTGIEVSSAGLTAWSGRPADERTAVLVPELAPGFRARQLAPSVLAGVDLVLTMTRAQRGSVVGRAPALVRRTFTLVEFSELADLVVAQGAPLPPDPVGRLRELVDRAPRARAQRAGGPGTDDVPDPVSLGADEYADVIGELRATCTRLVSALQPASLPAPQ